MILLGALRDTLAMIFGAFVVGGSLGFLFGILLFGLRHPAFFPCRFGYGVLSALVNATRSFPFAIFLILLLPFTRWVVGTTIGTAAATVPLSLAAAPYVARLVEQALQDVRPELLEMGLACGARRRHLLYKTLIPESLPRLIDSATLTLINLVGYSAMAGLVGGGGLGKVAIDYGYYRFDAQLMLQTTVILILLVEGIERIGNSFRNYLLKRRGLAA